MEDTEATLREQIVRLEETAAHQTRMIEDLSAEIAEQWKVIDQLQVRLDRLTEQFRTLADTVLEAPAASRPPHY
jgi:SlyX protein